MPPRDVHPLDYASGDAVRKPRTTLFEWGATVGIVAIGVSLTFGADEGADGYVRYLYPLTVPLLDYVFGKNQTPNGVLFAACALYWPTAGLLAQIVVTWYSKHRRRNTAA